jgi:hypothetical protein
VAAAAGFVCRDSATKPQILADARWSNIAAVRNHRLYVNPQGVYVWSVRSAESALQPLWAAKTFHPDLFADIDMTNEVRQSYPFLSGTRPDQSKGEAKETPGAVHLPAEDNRGAGADGDRIAARIRAVHLPFDGGECDVSHPMHVENLNYFEPRPGRCDIGEQFP